METIKKQAVIYSRRGVDKDKNSFDEQIDISRNYCTKSGIIITKEFTDYGRFIEHGQISLLFDYLISAVDVNTIIVSTEDRIICSTNPTRLYQHINSLLTLGRAIEIIAVAENANCISLEQLQRSLFSSLTSYEQAKRDEKSHQGLVENALQGNWIGVLPRGYKRIVIRDYDIVQTNDAKVLRIAFEMKLSNTPNREILIHLNDNGIAITLETLRGIFKNVFYAGYVRTKLTGGKLVKGRHDGIITLEEYYKIQALG